MALSISKKYPKVNAPEGNGDVIAYQVLEFTNTVEFFNKPMIETHDTAIYANGEQRIIGGDGFIPHGMLITEELLNGS